MSLTPNSSPMIQLTGGMGVASAPGTPTTPLGIVLRIYTYRVYQKKGHFKRY